jgi:hypothetical protein
MNGLRTVLTGLAAAVLVAAAVLAGPNPTPAAVLAGGSPTPAASTGWG